MIRVWLIAKTTLLENSRKQVFHVLCLLMVAVIASSSLLSILTEGVKLKILKDLCMTCMMFGGAVLAIALGATGIPNDVESRTVHPVLARPITRVQYVVGKFFGTFITVGIGVGAMALAFGVLIYAYEHSFDTFLLTATGFTLLEVAVVAAVATAISTAASPAITAVVTFLIYIAGTTKIGYLGGMIERSSSGSVGGVYRLIYHVLPNLECFNLKTALVHHDVVPTTYLIQVAVYGAVYTAFVLLAGCACFARREV